MSSRPTVFCMVPDQIFMEMSWRPDAAQSDSGVPPSQSHSLFGCVKVEVMICPLTPGLLSALRNPPADHWCLVSGLPTYVAETGLVSVLHLCSSQMRRKLLVLRNIFTLTQ